jgi:hypothetical protein
MSVTPETVQQAQQVIETLDRIKSGTFVGIIILVAMIAVVVVIFWYLRYKERVQDAATAENTEKRKEARQQAYLDAQKNLADSLNQLTLKFESDRRGQQGLIEGVSESVVAMSLVMGRVETLVNTILAKQSGEIPDEQVFVLADCLLNTAFCERARGVFTQSLLENDYEKRAEFISRKVRTELGSVLSTMRNYLRGVPCHIKTDKFFVVDRDNGAERFVLVDTVWHACEALYRDHQTPTAQRLEQLKYLVTNTVRDYYDQRIAELIHSAPRPIIRTPSGGFTAPERT